MQRPVASLANLPATKETPPTPSKPLSRPGDQGQSVSLLNYPHPHAAMMAICSDLDGTPSQETYWEVARFLNTREDTPMGRGVGLEVGNSIYFNTPAGRFGYWRADERGRRMIRALIASGHIDCLHSYGGEATLRQHARRAIRELQEHQCSLKVWVDHSKSPSNFGPDIMFGQGDVVGSPAYHADLTLRYGIRYVWRGRTSSLIGQNAPADFRWLARMLQPSRPLRSGWTLLKEAVKIHLGRIGWPRWRMHAANAVLRQERLRDGHQIWEFMRANWHWGGQGRCANAASIPLLLTRRFLELLCRRRGACVWYTHLNMSPNPQVPFDASAKAALRLLAKYHDEQRILTTTTYRLLRYLSVRDHLRYRLGHAGGRRTITIESVDDPVFGAYRPSLADLQGITFMTDPSDRPVVRLADGREIACQSRPGPRATYLTVPWQPLTFPEI